MVVPNIQTSIAFLDSGGVCLLSELCKESIIFEEEVKFAKSFTVEIFGILVAFRDYLNNLAGGDSG